MIFTINNQNELLDVCKELFDCLRERGVPEERAFDGKLIASELICNVLKHAASAATLTARVDGGAIELTVYSPNGFEPPLQSVCSDVYAESGRGLFLVDALSAERSYTSDGGIKVVIKY